ncbi:MAG: alpha/beta fold hydrolase [Sphingomonadaceae bacterium]
MSEADAPNILTQARAEFERAMQRNIKGIEYFSSPAPVLGASAKELILSKGTLKLYHYHPRVDEIYRVPIMLVMATTNRGYIFDMVPGQSFVEFLLNAGYDVFMVDWDVPRADEKHLSIEDYILDFLPSCVNKVIETTGEPDLSVVGYCFGGVLSLLWAALNPDGPMKNLVTFTTPIDFKGMPMFQAWSDQRFFDVDRLVETHGNCPAEMLYSAFDMLRPGGRIAGNLRLWDNLWNDEYVKGYRMVDRWSSDMLPLAGRYFEQTIKKLMWENALYEGTMDVGGRTIDLGAITAPFMHVVAQHDHIVPYEASKPLVGMIGSADKQELVLKGGHVSLVAGANAVKRLWPNLDLWLQERSL